jgi:uncharacterized tellurite resistance protein B-like protein
MKNRSEKYEETIVTLYHLISLADGEISERELQMCSLLRRSENIDETNFNHIIKSYNGVSQTEIYRKCVNLLRTCTLEEQVGCLAWMRYIANCDGFMAREEWSIIFKIYKKELNLNLNEIMNYELPVFVTTNG